MNLDRQINSPSNLDRREACPGSARMEEGLPDEESEESREGTELHLFMAHPEYDRSVLKPQLRDLLRTTDDIEEDIFKIVRQNEGIPEEEEFVQRHEVEGQCGELVGHIDLVRRYPERNVTVIIDWKFGWVLVERAELNIQLRGYAITSTDDTVYTAIGQPRAPRLQRLTIAKYTMADLEQSRAQIQAIINRTKEPNARLHPGTHCRYCKARGHCPALKAAVSDSLVPIGILSPDFSKAKRLGIAEARLAEMSDQALSQMMDAYSLVMFVHEPMLDEARRRIEAGKLGDWKLAKAIERRKIVDSQRAIALLNLAGMPREEVLKCANVSLTKLEELLNHGTLRTGEVISGVKDAKAFTSRVLNSVIEIETQKSRVLKK